MTCANFQVLEPGLGAATATVFTPAEITFPYDSTDDLRLDIYNYQDQAWVNVPLATGATINVGGAGDRFYAWNLTTTNGQTGVTTILATAGTTPALPGGQTASHPLAAANNNYPVQGGVGANVRLYRQTAIDAGELPAYFYPGASIRAEDLNDNFEALRKVVEESNCATNNINDGSAQLDARYWNKVLRANGGDTIPAADVPANWVSDDAHIATTAAGDARWLNATGNNVQGRDMITATETGGNILLDVDLAAVSGLESTNPGNAAGELRIDTNLGCEIVANGLNTQTTSANVQQTGGNNDDPAIRITETLGGTVTNTDLQITGGANVTVTRNSNTGLTIAAPAVTGGSTFRGTVDVDDDNTLPGTAGQQNPNAVAPGDAFTVENNVAAANVTANWNTVLDNWVAADGTINSGDVILCTTGAAVGSPTNARYNLIRTGGNINTLQQVTDAGNTTTTNILLQSGGNTNTSLNADGSAVFNEQGASVDFRVESPNNANMLLVDGSADNVGINEASPSETLDVRGNIQVGDGGSLRLQNADEDEIVSINADDATATYNITLPPAAPAAGTRYLRAAGTGTGANQELEWATGGGGATGGNTATQQDYVFQENAQVVRHNYTVGTTLAAQPGSGVTTATCNALSAGPVTINNGVTVTIANGSNWVVI